MKRFGGTESFLGLLDQARRLAPAAGARSNVIVGFPGETEADVAELEAFLTAARLDGIGVFGYSDEDGTAAAGFAGHLDEIEIAARVEHISVIVDELLAQRAEDRMGEVVRVLIENVTDVATGRARHQGPDDGEVTVSGLLAPVVGDVVTAVVTGTSGADLTALASVSGGDARPVLSASGAR